MTLFRISEAQADEKKATILVLRNCPAAGTTTPASRSTRRCCRRPSAALHTLTLQVSETESAGYPNREMQSSRHTEQKIHLARFAVVRRVAAQRLHLDSRGIREESCYVRIEHHLVRALGEVHVRRVDEDPCAADARMSYTSYSGSCNLPAQQAEDALHQGGASSDRTRPAGVSASTASRAGRCGASGSSRCTARRRLQAKRTR